MPPSTAATTRSRRSIEYARMASAVPIKQSAHCCQTTVGDRFEDGRPARCCTAAVLRCPGSRSFRGPCSSWGSRHSAGCRLLVALVLAVVVVVPVVLAVVVVVPVVLAVVVVVVVPDRKSVVQGKSVDLGGCRIIKKKLTPSSHT